MENIKANLNKVIPTRTEKERQEDKTRRNTTTKKRI